MIDAWVPQQAGFVTPVKFRRGVLAGYPFCEWKRATSRCIPGATAMRRQPIDHLRGSGPAEVPVRRLPFRLQLNERATEPHAHFAWTIWTGLSSSNVSTVSAGTLIELPFVAI